MQFATLHIHTHIYIHTCITLHCICITSLQYDTFHYITFHYLTFPSLWLSLWDCSRYQVMRQLILNYYMDIPGAPNKKKYIVLSFMPLDNPFRKKTCLRENQPFGVAGVPPVPHFLQVAGNVSKSVGPSYTPQLRTSWPRAKPLVDT